MMNTKDIKVGNLYRWIGEKSTLITLRPNHAYILQNDDHFVVLSQNARSDLFVLVTPSGVTGLITPECLCLYAEEAS